jgi:hypothetical protein
MVARCAGQSDESRRRGRLPWPLLIFALALSTRLLIYLHSPPRFDFAETENIARTLAETGRFADPYKVPTGPTAHTAPLYPLLLAGIFTLFGYGSVAAWAQTLVNVSLASVQYALLPAVSAAAGYGRRPGILAGVAGAALPIRALREGQWEASLAGLLCVLAILALLEWWKHGSLARSFGTGLLCAAAVLSSAALLTTLLVVIAVLAFRGVVRLRYTAVVIAGLVAGLLPWTVRNYCALGGFVPVRSNFWLEFSLSNRDGAYPDSRRNEIVGYPNNDFHRRHPYESAVEAAKVKELGEVGYAAVRKREAATWVRSHWHQFAVLTAERVALFWFPDYGESQPWKAWLCDPITVLGFIGLLLSAGTARFVFWAIWLTHPLVYYVIQSDTRYRYPMEWTVWLLAAVAVTTLPAWVKARLAARGGTLATRPSDSTHQS